MKLIGLFLLLLCLTFPADAAPVIEKAFSPNQGATALIVATIGKAHKTIRVAAYILTSHPIANALVAAKDRGVNVKIVIDRQESTVTGSAADYLTHEGVAVRRNGQYNNMHDKFMVIDDDTVEMGSFNYTRAAEEENAENILVIHDDPELAKAYLQQWDRLWAEGK